jgi:hypothetical protein
MGEMFFIEDIQAMFDGKAVKYSLHFWKRRQERIIKHSEVKQALLTGKIIEECPDDEPLPSVLILGYTNEGKPLHVAVGVSDDKICLITVYEPTLDIWEDDFKTKKEVEQL